MMRIARDALSDISIFGLVILAALGVDWALHQTGNLAWGRYFGYLGTALLLVSFTYSARKRKWIQRGQIPKYLSAHEVLAWVGALLILVHGGVHFNALLPWLAMAAMLVAVASGLTGKYLLRRSRAVLSERKKSLREDGATAEELEEQLYWDSLVVDLMKKWRVVHIPITTAFALLATLHVVTMLIFWRW